MYEEGQIIFFNNFRFNNGGQSKDKYFIVLKRTKYDIIFGSLPTRNNKVPAFVDKPHGCIDIEERVYNCYIFQAKRPVCTNGFNFDLPTFIYGGDVDSYPYEYMITSYTKENVHYAVQGQLTQQELKDIIDCIANSPSVKRKVRKALKPD